jgi:hypothetical protein
MDPISVANPLESAAAAIAVARLIYLKLGRQFPALVAWLSVLSASDFAYSLLSPQSALYFWIYVAEQPVLAVFGVLAVRELLAVVFRDYPGIRSVGRWGVYAGVAVASSASMAASIAFAHDHSHGSLHLFYLEVFQRSVVFTLALVILSVLFVLSRYPLHLSRNSIVSSVFFSSIFLSDAVRLLIDSLSIRLNNQMADLTETAVVLLCLGTWAVLLQAEAAGQPAVISDTGETLHLSFANPAEAHLLSELDSLNRLLTRAARN